MAIRCSPSVFTCYMLVTKNARKNTINITVKIGVHCMFNNFPKKKFNHLRTTGATKRLKIALNSSKSPLLDSSRANFLLKTGQNWNIYKGFLSKAGQNLNSDRKSETTTRTYTYLYASAPLLWRVPIQVQWDWSITDNAVIILWNKDFDFLFHVQAIFELKNVWSYEKTSCSDRILHQTEEKLRQNIFCLMQNLITARSFKFIGSHIF